MSLQPDVESVRELAYRLWVERGSPEGEAQADWFEAERQLLGRRRTDSQIADEAAKESFPASDAPASGLPDKPPVNAGEKWATAKTGKRRKSAAGKKPSNGDGEPEKLGSRDAPGG